MKITQSVESGVQSDLGKLQNKKNLFSIEKVYFVEKTFVRSLAKCSGSHLAIKLCAEKLLMVKLMFVVVLCFIFDLKKRFDIGIQRADLD